MKGKILFLTGLGLGYVLGTRAGRERYEQLKASAAKLWNDPRVQRQVDTVGAYVKDKAPEFVDLVSDGAKKVAAQVAGTKTTAAKKPASTSSAKPSTRSSTSSKPSTAKSSGSSSTSKS